MGPAICHWPTRYWCRSGGPAPAGPARKESALMATAAIYARVSSARQAKDETIASQTLALREHARVQGLDVPEEWGIRRCRAFGDDARAPGPGTAAGPGRPGRHRRGAGLFAGPAGP